MDVVENRGLRSNRLCLLAAMLEVSVQDIGCRLRSGPGDGTRLKGAGKDRHRQAVEYLRTFRNDRMFQIAADLGMPIPNKFTVERIIEERTKETAYKPPRYTMARFSLVDVKDSDTHQKREMRKIADKVPDAYLKLRAERPGLTAIKYAAILRPQFTALTITMIEKRIKRVNAALRRSA